MPQPNLPDTLQLERLFDGMADPLMVLAPDWTILFLNAVSAANIGRGRAEIIGQKLSELFPIAEHEDAFAHMRRALDEQKTQRFDTYSPTLEHWYHVDAYPGDGWLILLSQNITDRKVVEAEMGETVARLEQELVSRAGFMHHALDILCTTDAKGNIVDVSQACERSWGYTPDELRGKSYVLIVHPDDKPAAQAIVAKIRAGEAIHGFNNRCLHKNGGIVHMTWSGTWSEEDGLLYSVGRDVTAQREAERALSETQERFRLAAKATSDVLYDWNILTGAIWWSDGMAAVFGVDPGAEGAQFDWWKERIHPDDEDAITASLDAAVDDAAISFWDHEYRFLDVTGRPKNVRDRGYFLRNEQGRAVRMVGGISDLTERKHLQAQLLQSQKMEGIGRLAGGVAHDFNNLLTAMLGYVDMILAESNEKSPFVDDVMQIRTAATRAVDLTRQLLAFARKQIIAPEVIDVNEVIMGMHRMLTRVLGEDIDLVTHLGAEPAKVSIDPTSFDQVVVNLAVNSRDAMPNGGALTIDVTIELVEDDFAQRRPEVTPGKYVVLAVSDSGCGIPGDALPYIFEPFFTTKERGKGTGLGLPTCFGIVKQANGHIWIYSEVGEGTTVKVYLPLAEGAAVTTHATPLDLEETTGTETILLVEDEAVVRDVTAKILRGFGYRVVVAAAPVEAIAIARDFEGVIDLLLTDVVMPQMSGKEVAVEVARLRPATRILFMSGYTENAIVHHGVLDKGIAFIEKPFTPKVLGRKVRTVLDAPE